jgi:hypothetical protein
MEKVVDTMFGTKATGRLSRAKTPNTTRVNIVKTVATGLVIKDLEKCIQPLIKSVL